ncbi:hypothetical protein ILYODFUR_025670 [Ilyodon furcidens]|uniref:Uncharacterized protein n=1 Tax=Ilyodon furcidens TaxID=33524 RepID=A0ABV0SSR4_9TELE
MFLFNSPVDLSICSSHSQKTSKPEIISKCEAFKQTCRLLPEEDVPEKQPTWINHQGNEWVNQRTVQVVVQHSLRNNRQVQQPTVLEADWHFLQLLEEKHREEERAGWAEDHQDDG